MLIIHISPEINFAKNFVLPLISNQISRGHVCKLIMGLSDYKASSRLEDFKSALPSGCDAFFCSVKVSTNPVVFLSSLFSLASILRKEDPDVIVFHTSLDSFFPLLISRCFLRARRIYFNHGVPYIGYKGLLRLLLKIIEIANLKNAHSVMTVGHGMCSVLNGLSPTSRVEYVEPGSACGINLVFKDYTILLKERVAARHRLGFEVNERVVLYVGRAVERKGIYDLISAWCRIGNIERFKLLVIGPTEDQIALDRYREIKGLKVIGYSSDVAQYYMASDVLCVPSHHEGFGYSYVEAASFGCVPICCDILGPTDFVRNNETGLVVNVGDIDSLRLNISKLLSNDSFRNRLAESSFAAAQAFERSVLIDEVCDRLE